MAGIQFLWRHAVSAAGIPIKGMGPSKAMQKVVKTEDNGKECWLGRKRCFGGMQSSAQVVLRVCALVAVEVERESGRFAVVFEAFSVLVYSYLFQMSASDPDETLVMRRSRRSTAGNRMEAALAEMVVDDPVKDGEDDIDFVNDKEEEDIFESDFESTDEEIPQEDAEAGDRIVQDEEKQARKAARARVAKSTALAHARQKVTFQPHAQSHHEEESLPTEAPTSAVPAKSKPKRHVSLGVAVNVQPGEVIEGVKGKRQSQRKHTVMNTSETFSRMKISEAKRAAAIPKRVKNQIRALTQGELIARALDNEEGNIVEHRDYLKLEEEKRKRARVVRPTIDGPLLKWVTRTEEVNVIVDPPMPPLTSPYEYAYGTTTADRSSGLNTQMPCSFLTSVPYYQHLPPQQQPTQLLPSSGSASLPQVNDSNLHVSIIPSTPLPQQPIGRTEKVAKTYVVHELGQCEGFPKPTWKDTMEAMFGDHAQWEDLRVFVGKGRPLSRPKQLCPITGKYARYLDPRTSVPFADVPAFKIITKILAHEYVWSDTLGCYTSHQGFEHTGLGASLNQHLGTEVGGLDSTDVDVD